MMRLDMHCSSMALCLDHYRLEVLGRDSYKTAGPAFGGCANCKALQRSDGSGGRLLACSACGCVFYCSKDCQKAHWREHKPQCKPAAAKAGSSSSGTQGTAAAAGSCSSGGRGTAPAAGSSSSSAQGTAAAAGSSAVAAADQQSTAEREQAAS
uniref:MYND-type domain-containing protein n=1 Tax=Tetradesmus obliquus TaxID=3088 RepID=A0A383W4U2_TETOB|eukprot:jgi/Sobl393_1/13992/SZX71686.1